MESSVVLCVLLAALAALVTAERAEQLHANGSLRLHDEDVRNLLTDQVLARILDQPAVGDESYTKLEKMLVDALLSIRNKLSEPQPEFGLPALDPFVLDESMTYSYNTSMIYANIELKKAFSTGLSKFQVNKLSLYLLETVGVLDLVLPALAIELVVNFPKGTWITPLKIPIDEQVDIRFHTRNLKAYLRGRVSLKDGKLSVNSTNLVLDLGEIELMFVHERNGTDTRNRGILDLLADLIMALVPRLLEDWKPVLEVSLAKLLNEKLQDLQIKDLLDPDSLASALQ